MNFMKRFIYIVLNCTSVFGQKELKNLRKTVKINVFSIADATSKAE